MAEHDQILVFRPCFPTQKLSELLYKWRLPVSAPDLQGYIDPQHPHAVNSMLIAKLGTQEVLVCACDDGDFILYYTHFLREISITKDYKFDADHHLKSRPLMIGNVKRSAWGIAIHTNARILAVSCNTHEVSVFKFALTDDAVLYNDPQKEWQYPGRSKDDLHVFKSHLANVPNISFFNSDLDKEGRYLVSTDLTGVIILWDLRERSQIKRIKPVPSLPHLGGWSIACVDPRAFLLVKSDFEFLGCKREQDRNGTYDITQCRSHLKNSSINYPEVLPSRTSSPDPRFFDVIMQRVATTRRELLRILEARQQMEQIDVNVERANVAFNQIERRHAAGPQGVLDRNGIDRALTNDGSNEDEDDVIENEHSSEDDPEEEQEDFDLDDNQLFDTTEDPMVDAAPEYSEIATGSASAGRRLSVGSSGEFMTQIRTTETMDASLFMDDDTEGSASDAYAEESDGLDPILISEHIVHHNSQNSSPNTISTWRDPDYGPFLLIHTGQDFVSLQGVPCDNLAVISRDPCHQHLPTNMAWLLHYDRLHLSQLIPELNLFVTATAAGRAAIYTLTRKVTGTKSGIDDEYGMRLDFVVPFTSQEERKERPATFLIGLAAAPIQGHQMNFGNVMSGQRWRLALTYHDHTVMNYELWREGRSCSASVFI